MVNSLTNISQAKLEKEQALREKVREAFCEWYACARQQPVNSKQFELMRSSWNEKEFTAILDVLMDDHMTMGVRTTKFEEIWSDFVGSRGALMVNSGSSANLLALSALASPDLPNGLRHGDEVIVPAVTWSTSVFPIVQMGCVPVFVDINLDTLNLDTQVLSQAITSKTRAIVAVHLLGNPCEMNQIMDLARRHSLWVIEDCCEAHGAKVGEQEVGTFGDLSTFSFFFSHHMTTIEGGVICFRDREYWRDRLISLRAHGWIRGRSDYEQWKSKYPAIDSRWLFVSLGYNFRPTEINAAIGLSQIEKLPTFVQNRQLTRQRLLELLAGKDQWLRFQIECPGHTHSAFGFSFLVHSSAPFSKKQFQTYLEEHHIETRPILGSNLVRQPAMQHIPHRIHGTLTNADLVHYNGFMIGNHQDVTSGQVDYIVAVISDFLSNYK